MGKGGTISRGAHREGQSAVLACAVWFLICVAVAIHHTCFSHTYHLAIHHTCLSHTWHLAIYHTCLSHTWHLEYFRPATRTSTLDYNSTLLSITDLCARYTYYSLCASKLHKLFRSVQKKALAISVPLPHRYHEPTIDCTVHCLRW